MTGRMRLVCATLSWFCGLALAAETDTLPVSGRWHGVEQCMVQGGGKRLPGSPLQLIIRNNEVYNAYGESSNSMFASLDPAGGLTPEQPDFIRGLMDTPVLSNDGREMFSRLAAVLESPPPGIASYDLEPSASLVEGRMFCLAGEGWCHFEAVKRVRFGDQSYEVQGGDMMRDYGDRMIRVGYAYDRYGCAPEVCVYVCEADLVPE